MEDLDLGQLAAMIEDTAKQRVNAVRAMREAEMMKPFSNPRFERPRNPRIPFIIKGSEETSYGYRVEQMIESRFADVIRKKIALSDDQYLDKILAVMKSKTEEEFNTIVTELGSLIKEDNFVERFKMDCAYFAGYFDLSTRLYVEQITGYAHPVLGSVREIPELSSEELLAIADTWNRQFIDEEIAAAGRKKWLEEEALREKEMEEKLTYEKLNHHSNKVRRRNKKKVDKQNGL